MTVLLLASIELGLRILNPQAVKFASDFRLTYRYHERWYVDFEPDTSSTIQLRDHQEGYFLNFLLTINQHGFRWYDRELDAPLPDVGSKQVIHAIGDSFTMGWGVNYESSYPALLQEKLPSDFSVINLGLNGFGTIGATGKSLDLAKEFPPAAVVYLATANDYQDDVIATEYSTHSPVIHGAFDLFNVARRYIRLPNLWYATRWWLYYRPLQTAPKQPWSNPQGVEISTLTLEGGSNPQIGSISKSALSTYYDALEAKNVPLVVIAHGDSEVSRDIARYARELGAPSYLVEFPGALKMRGEGHLNHPGNNRLAEFVLRVLEDNGLVDPLPSDQAQPINPTSQSSHPTEVTIP